MLYQLTKRRKSNVKVWTTDVFLDISKKLLEKPKAPFTNVDISKLFFGLNSMPERHPNVENINNSLCHVLRHSYSPTKYPWSSYNISCAMYYLRHHQCNKKHVRDLISVIVGMIGPIDSVDRPMSTAECGNTLYGLQGLSSDTECVRNLLVALRPHLELCEVEVDSFFLADFYALQGLSSNSVEVRTLLGVLSAKLAVLGTRPIPIKAVQVCRALYGLQLLRMEHEGVHKLVGQLVPFSELPTGAEAVTHPKDLALVLDGLRMMFTETEARLAVLRVEHAGAQSMGEDLDELAVRLQCEENSLATLLKLLAAVGRFQLQCRYSTSLNTDQLSRILYSFRGYSSNHAEVRRLLENLLPFVRAPVVTLHQSSYSDSRPVTDMLSVHNSIRVAGGSSFYRRINAKARDNGNGRLGGSSGAQIDVPSGNSSQASGASARPSSKFDAYQVAIIKQGLAGIRPVAGGDWDENVRELDLALRDKGVADAIAL